MAKINVSELEPDMVLANDVRDRNGRFLLGNGVKLTPKHLKIMKMWGIVDVDIEGLSQNDMEKKRTAHMDPAILDIADKLTRKRFVHTDLRHEAICELFNICVLRKAEQLTNGAQPAGTDKFHESSTNSDQNSPTEDTAAKVDPHDLIKKNYIKLPSLSPIFNQINEAINNPRSSATQVAKIISNDSGLSAQLLKLVNSAFYNFPSKIDTISRAVAIIGTKQLSTLALGTCVTSAFQGVPSDLINMRSFWEHSIACGIIARLISSYKNNINTERFFLAGLLHDLGRLIIYKYLPAQAKQALLRARKTNNLLYKTEKEIMGFNHTVMGSILLKEWKLPVILENTIRHHHSPEASQMSLETSIIHLSDIVTNALGIGTSGEQLVPPLDVTAWEDIGLPAGILATTIKQANRHIAETVHIFFPDER
ncbi:MAG: HDOD domain-containing protein [Pseudomonadota bacterium]